MRRAGREGLSRFQAGLILIVGLVIVSYLGFTKAIPFRHHWSIKADFNTAPNVRVGSFVRTAGVNVGKVTAAEPLGNGKQGVRVTLRIDEAGRPIHKDATIQLRPNIFLEGNTFIDLRPGTPTAPILGDGELIPATHTSTPVQIDQVLTALQSDVRADLQTLLYELSAALSGRGAVGYNRSIQYWLPAFRGTALVNEATLGLEPHDLSRYLSSQGRFAAALDRNPPALKSLISDFNTTARAFAREQVALRETLTELPRTLRNAQPALAALNSSFPPLRRLAADLRPATRSTGPMIDASLPFITQLRLLVSPGELQGLVFDLRQAVPELARLNAKSPELYEEVRLASSCQNEVILPWSHQKIDDPNFPAKGEVYQESVKGLPGLAAETRAGDANGQWARVLGGNGAFSYKLNAGPSDGSIGPKPRVGITNFPLEERTNPPKSDHPKIQYHEDCETQEVPDVDSRPSKQALKQIDENPECNILIPIPLPAAILGFPTTAVFFPTCEFFAILLGPVDVLSAMTGVGPTTATLKTAVASLTENMEIEDGKLKIDGKTVKTDGKPLEPEDKQDKENKEKEEKEGEQDEGLPEPPKEDKDQQDGSADLSGTGVSGSGEAGDR
jgi:phospholipid/cholesterol/gamma-HCH transport system substrate-binding protein